MHICDTMNGLMRSDFDFMPKADFLKDFSWITEEVYDETLKEFQRRETQEKENEN